MVEIRSKTRHENGVTFVSAVITNSRSTAQRIRVESQLDGETWPPYDGRMPRPEWDGNRWEGNVPAGESIGIGFASPAQPVEPAVEMVGIERVQSTGPQTKQETVATLDRWEPPLSVLRDQE